MYSGRSVKPVATSEPESVHLDVVAAIHEAQLAEHSGSPGVRDWALLEMAAARPRHLHAYGDRPSLYELAAAYAFGLAKNHPFVDGNKRTAWVVCALFLELNGVAVSVDEQEVVPAILALSAGQLVEEHFADWLQQANTRPV